MELLNSPRAASCRKAATCRSTLERNADASPAGSFGDEGARTPDLPDANRTLYQLSYVPARGDFQLSA